MNVRWSAVFFGALVDFALSLLLQVLLAWSGLSSFFVVPNPERPLHLLLLLLFSLITGVGGFLAARLADDSFVLNGLMVGVTNVLVSAIVNPGVIPVPQPFVINRIVGCALAALGGYLAALAGRRGR